jgi:two-component system response regulator YesN
MYKLIIVDDEPLFREKFSRVIDWESFGFHLSACLPDGRDAVRYIQENHVDVIFTDVQMTFLSGVDLAKYVCENYPAVKVVLNTGHSVFEYARRAVEYGVFKYLLKPTKRAAVEECLRELKTALDKICAPPVDGYVHSLLKRQALFDIVSGVLTGGAIARRLEKIGFPLDVDATPCVCFRLNFPERREVAENDWNYTKNDLYTAVESIAADSLRPYYEVYPINYIDGAIEFSAVYACGKKSFERLLENFAANAREILGFEIVCERVRYFSSVKQTSEFSERDLGKLKNFFISCVNDGDDEAAERAASLILETVKSMPAAATKVEIADLFHTVNKISGKTSETRLPEVREILEYSDGDYLRLCERVLSAPPKLRRENIANYKYGVVAKAKEYIAEKYREDISLENVANYVYLNKVYFCRLFKQVVGESFNDYLTLVRMQKAIELLRDSRNRVHEVCELVGYKSPRHFYKLFKRHTGCTPSEYRNHHF